MCHKYNIIPWEDVKEYGIVDNLWGGDESMH